MTTTSSLRATSFALYLKVERMTASLEPRQTTLLYNPLRFQSKAAAAFRREAAAAFSRPDVSIALNTS